MKMRLKKSIIKVLTRIGLFAPSINELTMQELSKTKILWKTDEGLRYRIVVQYDELCEDAKKLTKQFNDGNRRGIISVAYPRYDLAPRNVIGALNIASMFIMKTDPLVRKDVEKRKAEIEKEIKDISKKKKVAYIQ